MKLIAAADSMAAPENSSAESVRLRQAAEAFEALLLQMMLQKMRQAQLQEGLFGDGAGSQIYEGLFDLHVSQHLAVGSPLGIAEDLEDQWGGDGGTSPGSASQALAAAERARGTQLYDRALAAFGSASGTPQVPGPAADE